jgi:UbiD family decarboxylase
MGYNSLRQYITDLREDDLYAEVDVEVERDWEVGTVCRETFDRRGPALQFNAVGDYDTPLVVGVLDTYERYSKALDVEADFDAITEKWQDAYENPMKPEQVDSDAAPVKRNHIEDVNLNDDPFPVPQWHELDAGRELGTLHAVITKDPEEGWVNVGTYRNQIMDETTLGCLVIPYRHIGQHWRKWKEMGEDMPIAIATGLEPALSVTSVSAVPAGQSEYDVAGALKGSPIEVVEAETSDLPVPANAEIVIEGTMPIDDFLEVEAPFGEFPGYMGEQVEDSHYIDVDLVTHRNDPVFQGTYEGRPPNESTTVRHIGRTAAMDHHLDNAGIPGVEDICVTPNGCAGFHTVVSLDKQYPGHVRDVMGHVWGHPNIFSKHCTVVDDDIDPWNESRVNWATHTRVQADRDIEIVENGKSIVLDPSQVPSRRGWSTLLGIDATKPHDAYGQEDRNVPETTEPPVEWLAKVRDRWDEYDIHETESGGIGDMRRTVTGSESDASDATDGAAGARM